MHLRFALLTQANRPLYSMILARGLAVSDRGPVAVLAVFDFVGT
jgi:hypothetical protein